ncbi:putative PAN domain protein [Anopheles sinensis]|uniref:Putative PAN domain protein n=1 Tax=Anopheles sinensis TaxID=74873 RepID=A0A084VPP4_ANOSI|nr:putative PAN domain protein [Anopheles sinensis]
MMEQHIFHSSAAKTTIHEAFVLTHPSRSGSLLAGDGHMHMNGGTIHGSGEVLSCSLHEKLNERGKLLSRANKSSRGLPLRPSSSFVRVSTSAKTASKSTEDEDEDENAPVTLYDTSSLEREEVVI